MSLSHVRLVLNRYRSSGFRGLSESLALSGMLGDDTCILLLSAGW